MYLSFKRTMYFDEIDATRMYNRYVKYAECNDYDDDYIDYIKLVDDEGELIYEYKRFE